jgi:DNA-directed RNA polymerase sigma subunit (sigma70/sigma32)
MPQPNQKPVKDIHLADGHEVTLREIGEHFGVHKNTIRDTEIRALRKFKIEIEKRGYKMEDFFRW